MTEVLEHLREKTLRIHFGSTICSENKMWLLLSILRVNLASEVKLVPRAEMVLV